MQNIKPYQLKKIYAIGNALQITESNNRDDDLHLLVAGTTGKESIKELTYHEANDIICQLEKMQGKEAPPKKKITKKHESVPGGITSEQQKKVWALMYELKKYDKEPNSALIGDRLCGIIKKELQISGTAKNPFAWINFETGNKLIEILKKYIASAKRYGG